METSAHNIATSRPRFTQRRPQACTECARRKLRCSKVIPCSACIERGISHLCYRENVRLRNRMAKKVDGVVRSNRDNTSGDEEQRAGVHNISDPFPPSASCSARPSPMQEDIGILHAGSSRLDGHSTPIRLGPDSDPTPVSPSTRPRETVSTPGNSSEQELQDSSLPLHNPLINGVTQETAITLEFLALGRQRVMRLGRDLTPESPPLLPINLTNIADPIVTPAQARWLVEYHEKNIAWMHNVIHMPTFCEQCDAFLESGTPISPLWLPLYYTVLSSTIYLTSPDVLQQCEIVDQLPLALCLHEKSIESLHTAKFMSNHSIFSVQTICMLIHCGHNYGESDLISTLMGCAIRIAQSLGIHRLGPDQTGSVTGSVEPQSIERRLIDREVSKRVWWFLIRQDWLQIPFFNTYTIHATQFNTPKPKNCVDSPLEIVNGGILEHEIDRYTQGSYTAVLNEIAVLLWQTQDRLCILGHPAQIPDGERRLYEEIIKADTELRKIIKRMPIFFRECRPQDETLPPNILQQKEATQLSLSHKFLSIHRHFQISCFRNPWFSYTKLSCLPVARRSLKSILALPDNEYTWTARSMWTVNTHIITATIALIFEQLFTSTDEFGLFESNEIQNLVQRLLQSLRDTCEKSQISRRGVRIIECLLELRDTISLGNRGEFDLEQIISYVKVDVLQHIHVPSHTGVEEAAFGNIDRQNMGAAI